MLYVPGIGKRHPFSCGEATLPGRHASITLKGPSQLGESLWSPSRFSTRRRTRSWTPSSLLCTIRWRWHLSAWLYRAFQVAACHLRSLIKSTSLRRSYSCIDSLKYWTREEPIRVSGGRQASAPWTRKDGVSTVARLVVIARVGVYGENILQDPSGD
jgi:hypothetical protein